MTSQKLNRKQQPSLRPPHRIVFPVPEVQTLSNGIKVFQINAGDLDVVSVEMIFKAGTWYQPKPFVALATNLMLREGSLRYSGAELAELIDFYGTHYEASSNRDSAFVSLATLNKHLANVIPLLAEAVKHPVFPETEFKVMAGEQRQMLEVNNQKVNYLARKGFNPIIFGEEHPYGLALQQEHIQNVDVNQLREFHKSVYNSSNCAILVAGRLTENLMQLLNLYFGNTDWPGNSAMLQHPEIVSSGERSHFQLKKGALQSAIRVGSLAVTRKHPDFEGLHVLTTLLGGYFGSRLMTNLREDKGYTYGIGSMVMPYRYSGILAITTSVGSEVTGQSLKEINHELLRLCEERVPENELELVRNYMLGETLRSINGPFAQASLYRELVEYDLGPEYLDAGLDVIKHITAAQLQSLAQEYLQPANLYTLVVGPDDYR